MEKPLIEIKNASAGYGDSVILHNVSLTINDKDFIGIIGPNGGGKTTLLRLMLGQIEPIEGFVNNNITPSNLRGAVGYLPQVSTIDKKFPITVMDVVLSGLMSSKRFSNKFTKAEKERAEAILLKTGIFDYRKKTIAELSGGQLQRTFLCRALISDPYLLILDEPNTFVDNRFEKELYNLLREINERMAIIMVSHDIGTITSYVKTIACVNRQLHYHNSNSITQEQLKVYDCPIQLITHGHVPHTVLKNHNQ